MQKIKICVIGSDGFIGRAMFSNFVKNGFSCIGFKKLADLQLWCATNLFSKFDDGIFIFIWAAGIVKPNIAELYPEKVKEEISLFKNFLNLIENYNSQVYFLSSGGCVYSEEGIIKFSETNMAYGVNSYGKMKIEMECELIASYNNHIILRLGNVYGPGQQAKSGQGVIAHWLNRIENQNPIILFGSELTLRDYIFIDDVTSAIMHCIKSEIPAGIYNVGTGVGTSLKELFVKFEKVIGKKVKFDISDSRNVDTFSYYLDSGKLLRASDWNPSIDLEEGLTSTLMFR